jgi:probable HAF family extracellular repeat protein
MHYKKNISLVLILFFTYLLQTAVLAQASFQGLGDLPGGDFFSSAHGVSPDDSVVVGYSITANGFEAFRWENNVITLLWNSFRPVTLFSEVRITFKEFQEY